jgi:hypothetical protein
MRIDRKQRDGRFVPFLELHVAPDEYHRDIGAQKADAPKHETGLADSVDRLEGVPVRRLYGTPPVQLSPKDLDEVGILGKYRRKAHAVVTIPRGFDFLQDSLDDLLISTHDCPPERADISDLSAQTVRILLCGYKGRLALRQNFNPRPKTGGSCILVPTENFVWPIAAPAGHM